MKGEKLDSPNMSVLPRRRSAVVCGAAGRQECFSGPHYWGPKAQPQVDLQPNVVLRSTKHSILHN